MLEKSKLILKIREIEENNNSNGSALQYSIIVNNLEKMATDLLATICEFMPEYTKHNIDHSFNVLKIIEKILPSINMLNMTELVLIVYAAVLHDIGMVANRHEIDLIKETEEYRSLLAEYQYDVKDEEVITEFIRRNHVKRSVDYIERIKSSYDTYGLNFEINGIDFSIFLKNIIYSHGTTSEELYDEKKFPHEILIGQEYVNIKYLCVLLRLADVLDFDKTRTPKFMYEHIGIKNEISLQEWKKHLSIEGHRIESNKIEFRARCSDAAIERCVRNFFEYIECERKSDIVLLNKCNSSKQLKLTEPIIYNVENDGSYLYSDVQIYFDYKKVLSILMGTNIYHSPEIFLRELLQNAYDACNTRIALENKMGKFIEPAIIKIIYDSKSKIISIMDNGIGMSDDDVNNYVVRVGHSYYNSKQYYSEQLNYEPISHFGIGMLSCFMVSDEIKIESLKYCKNREIIEPINIILKINESYVEKYPSSLCDFGTTISLKIKNDFSESLNFEKLVEIIKDNMSYQSIPVQIECDGEKKILNNSKIMFPEGLKKISGIQIIELDTELLEGYIVLYSYQHQTILKHARLCQQGFKISLNNGVPNLKPEWLIFLNFDVNIKKKYLTLKASRENVIANDNFRSIRSEIGKIIMNYFKNKPFVLSKFLQDGRSNSLSKIREENIFLSDAIMTGMIGHSGCETKTIRQWLMMLKGRKFKVAIIDPRVNDCFRISKEKYKIFSSDHLIISNQFNAYWFIQYVDSYIESIREVIEDCPGVVYVEAIINMEKDYKFPISNSNYTWRIAKCSSNELFCYIPTDQINFLDIILNENNLNVKMLNDNKEDIRVKELKETIEQNIKQRILNRYNANGSIIDYGGSYVNFLDNKQALSIQAIGCLEQNFAELLNEFIHRKYTNNELKEMKISNLYFRKENFITWWYKTGGYIESNGIKCI